MKLRNKKTGKIVECKDIVFARCKAFASDWETYTPNVNSLAELNEEWEDYKPTEPLIKDEKIRKAVRAWAALYDSGVVRAHIGEDYVSLFKDEVNGYSSSVGIDLSPDVFVELIDTHYYTIAELCGEEEE